MAAEESNIVGIIYSKQYADNMYGDVTESVNFLSSELLSLASSSGKYIMFNLREGNLIITDWKRNPLHPENAEFPVDEVFHYFSVSKLLELTELGGSEECSIEMRKDVFSITNGNFTLENTRPCPPYCP